MPLGGVKEKNGERGKRLSVYLTSEQHRFLENNSISKSEIIRKGLDRVIEEVEENGKEIKEMI